MKEWKARKGMISMLLYNILPIDIILSIIEFYRPWTDVIVSETQKLYVGVSPEDDLCVQCFRDTPYRRETSHFEWRLSIEENRFSIVIPLLTDSTSTAIHTADAIISWPPPSFMSNWKGKYLRWSSRLMNLVDDDEGTDILMHQHRDFMDSKKHDMILIGWKDRIIALFQMTLEVYEFVQDDDSSNVVVKNQHRKEQVESVPVAQSCKWQKICVTNDNRLTDHKCNGFEWLFCIHDRIFANSFPTIGQQPRLLCYNILKAKWSQLTQFPYGSNPFIVPIRTKQISENSLKKIAQTKNKKRKDVDNPEPSSQKGNRQLKKGKVTENEVEQYLKKNNIPFYAGVWFELDKISITEFDFILPGAILEVKSGKCKPSNRQLNLLSRFVPKELKIYIYLKEVENKKEVDGRFIYINDLSELQISDYVYRLDSSSSLIQLMENPKFEEKLSIIGSRPVYILQDQYDWVIKHRHPEKKTIIGDGRLNIKKISPNTAENKELMAIPRIHLCCAKRRQTAGKQKKYIVASLDEISLKITHLSFNFRIHWSAINIALD
jgi:hypothetical protein